jgi:hypothetical protein
MGSVIVWSEIFPVECSKEGINMTYVIAHELDDVCHTHTLRYW